MKRFLGSLFNTNHDEKEKITNHLYIAKEKEEGYWQVIFAKNGEVLLTTDDKEKAKRHARGIDQLFDWSKYKNVEDLKEQRKNGEYTRYQTFFGNNNMKIKLNGLYLRTKDANNNVTYKIIDENGERRVVGKLVTPGLTVHDTGTGEYKLHHVISGRNISTVDNFENAWKVATEISTLLPWAKENIPEILKTSPAITRYFSEVKQAVENGKEIPKMNEEVSLEFLACYNPKIRDRKEVYKEAMKELEAMTGMNEVKKQVDSMIKQLRAGHRLEAEGIKSKNQTLHMIFYGPPGTGKTQIARIIAKILYALGFLNKEGIVETDREGLVAGYVGQTAEKTKAKIMEAMGGVLFIDEAYSLASENLQGQKGDFGSEAIDTLMKAMEDYRSNLCVILAGYEADMARLLKMNDGMESRFPEHNRFYFRDFTPKEIAMVTAGFIKSEGYRLEIDTIDEIEKVVIGQSKSGSVNGNARWARNFTEKVIQFHKNRIIDENPIDVKTIQKVTILEAGGLRKKRENAEGMEQVKQEALEKLQNMIGLSGLKKEMEEIINFFSVQQRKFEKGLETTKPMMHMIFAGPPGTGKTTVAEYIGQILKGTGLLTNGHFKMVSGNELVQNFDNVLAKAKGGVLFIDEAYMLTTMNGGQQTVDLLIQEMENNRDNLVVILAGYGHHMKKLLDMNPGFESRIAYTFDFPYYSTSEIYKIVEIEAKKNHLILNDGAKVELKYVIEKISADNGGKIEGNGRWARSFVDKLKIRQANRIAKTNSDDLTLVLKEDIHDTYQVIK